MSITRKDVQHIAKLSRLEFSESDEQAMLAHFNHILEQVDKIAKIDTEGVPPTAHVLQKINVLREDVALPSLPPQELLQNAPEREDTAYLVPKVVE